MADVGVDRPVAGAPGRTVQVWGRSIRVVPPRLRDPRVHVAAVIVSVQVLGQTVIGLLMTLTMNVLAPVMRQVASVPSPTLRFPVQW